MLAHQETIEVMHGLEATGTDVCARTAYSAILETLASTASHGHHHVKNIKWATGRSASKSPRNESTKLNNAELRTAKTRQEQSHALPYTTHTCTHINTTRDAILISYKKEARTNNKCTKPFQKHTWAQTRQEQRALNVHTPRNTQTCTRRK